MKFLIRVAALAALTALGGCAGATLVPQSQSVTVGNNIFVTPQTQWNQFNINDHLVWTTQGVGVDSIHFVTGVKAGSPFIKILGVDSKALGAFEASMLPNDVQDLIVASLTRQGYENVRAGALAPCPFGAATGFCFELDFANKDGLAMKGMVMARSQNGVLDALLFQAPGEYYFAQLQTSVKSLFASVQTK